ncbi:MAG: formylmethanofuran dehydrogenase subunit C [Pirellulaceae bacterium]|nr:formylmethanofuran dehydrogenase subunit C [Pirellulaceae bacterium]
MSALTLMLKHTIPDGLRLQLGAIVPHRLQSLSVAEIARHVVTTDDERTTVGDWFDIADGNRNLLILQGDLARCDGIGQSMNGGQLHVVGSVGHFLADGMKAGVLTVQGNAGLYAAGGLRGGHVLISGNADDYLAAAAPGRRHGMRGGTVLVSGNVGCWAASRMRYGTVVVHGDIELGLALRMITGTVVGCGAVDPRLGCGMRRGTLLFSRVDSAATSAEHGPAGFTQPESSELSFLPMLLKQLHPLLPQPLAQRLQQVPFCDWPRRADRSLGDTSSGGLGEVIWLAL